MKQDLQIPVSQSGQAWIYRYTGQKRRPHCHDELELNLVIQGRGVYVLGDRQYELTPNSLLWLFPGQEHVLLNESSEFSCWIVLIRPAVLMTLCTTLETQILCQYNPSGSFHKRLSEKRAKELKVVFESLVLSQDILDFFNAGICYGILSSWNAFLKAELDSKAVQLHPAVEKTVRLIQQEADAISLEEIGQRVGLSAARLSSMFKQQTGVKLSCFRNRQRLERFLEMAALSPHCPMLQLALEAGFGSYPQFHRIFKQMMGYSPAEHKSLLHRTPKGEQQGTKRPSQ